MIWDSCKNTSYSRQKKHKLFSSREGDDETVPDAEDPLLSGLADEENSPLSRLTDEENSPLSRLADEEVDKLLKSEENQALLKDLGSAMQRVDSARQDLDEIDKREKGAAELRAYIQRLEGADSAIAESLREVSEAEARVRKAELALVTARAGGSIRDLSSKWEEADIDENAERIESIKASFVSAFIGTLASIPIALFQANSIEGLLIKEGIIFISCALFGVTYRYTVRQNLDNIKLKSGVVAAFGLVRGLSQFEGELPVDFSVNFIFSHALDTGFMLSESMFIFIAAAIALDYFMKMDLLNPFPSKKGMLM